MLAGKKILITGATGQAVGPCAQALAADNEVWAVARFSDPDAKAALEATGIKTFTWTMGTESLEGLAEDFTHVLHAAPYRGQPEFDVAAQANAVGAGTLMHHCRKAEAFIFVSTFAVYAKPPSVDHPVAESDPLGGYAPYAPSYPVGKAAAEGAVRAFARVLDLPSTIARLNVCYGPTGWGGLPVEFFARILAGESIWVPPDGSEVWNSPISTDDVTHFSEGLWDVASPDTTIVNLAGDDPVTLTGFMTYLADEFGVSADFVADERSRRSFASDNTRRKALLGDCTVSWRDGMRDAVLAHFSGAIDGSATEPVAIKTNMWNQR
jgi:UDP-glucuronate 4-epimerase